MTQIHEKTIKIIKQQKKNDPELYNFLESLLYGIWAKKNFTQNSELRNYNTFTKRASQCVLYLHEDHIQLLVCIDKWMTGYRKYFNVKNIQILELNPAYQMDFNLEKDKYLILRERNEETVILFNNVEKRNSFKKNLQKLRKVLKQIPDLYDPFVLKAFIKADLNQNGEISWSELKILIRMMKIDLNQNMKKIITTILRKDRHQKIYFEEFERMWKILYCRKQLVELFQKYNNEKFTNYDEYMMPKLDIKEFKRFLMAEQQQTEEESTKIIKRLYERDDVSLSFYDFCHYMFGQQNNLISENYKDCKINTSKPLNHYHCYSSHNTYLTGDQLFSSSRAERYLIDLQNGLRCVEIDVHDDSDGPIVKHGYTPTPSVTFEEVIKSVQRFTLLEPKHTPIILSIQNHCNQKNQLIMSKILKENFQNKILRVNPKLLQFPSLQECMGKIIIKGPGNFKLFMENLNTNSNVLEDSCSEEQSPDSTQMQSPKNPKKPFPQKKMLPPLVSKEQNTNQLKKKDSNNEINAIDGLLGKNDKSFAKSILKDNTNQYHQKFKVSGKFLQIICMLSKAKVQNVQKSHWQSNSFSEQKIEKFFLDENEFNKIRNLSCLKWFRSYPDGLRIWSSNYNPLPALQLGVQIVAINTQTKDDVNHHILKSFFIKGMNKTAGYRLKNELQKDGQNILTSVCINFISGLRIYQNDDDFKNIPAVSIRAYFTGTKRDNLLNQNLLAQRQYTEVIEKQAFSPKFSKSRLIEIKCHDPELGFLVISVPDCGRSVIPIDSIKPGWRVLSLYDHELKEKQSKILCQIKLSKIPVSK